MIVAWDANILVYLFDENAKAPTDPTTGSPVSACRERVEYLITTIQRDKAKIIIPTPALAEVLVKANEAGPEWLRIIGTSKHFKISPFDERAAVEFAAIQASRKEGGPKPSTPRAKAKFDDQIFAIAAVEGAQVIYSDDPDIRKLAKTRISVKGIAELPLAPEDSQTKMDLPPFKK